MQKIILLLFILLIFQGCRFKSSQYLKNNNVINFNVNKAPLPFVELSLKKDSIYFHAYQETIHNYKKNGEDINSIPLIYNYIQQYNLCVENETQQLEIEFPIHYQLIFENKKPEISIEYQPNATTEGYSVYTIDNDLNGKFKFYVTGVPGAYLIVPSNIPQNYLVGGIFFIIIKNLKHEVIQMIPVSLFHTIRILDHFPSQYS